MIRAKRFERHYEGAMEPFRMIGNVYFVGSYPASSHLIDTGEGLILIDTGYADTLFLLINSIYKLGFSPYDIKYIIHTHWHRDHTEASAALKHLSGAKALIGAKDAENAKKFFEPDILLYDGDVIRLGNTSIEVMETPGHTEGCISLFFETEEEGIKYHVGTFGGAGDNTLHYDTLEFPDARECYRSSLEKLRKKKVNVFIGNHVWNNYTEEKAETLRKTGENLFIDDKIFYSFLDRCEQKLNALIENENQ